jgi:hypothetical protein
MDIYELTAALFLFGESFLTYNKQTLCHGTPAAVNRNQVANS